MQFYDALLWGLIPSLILIHLVVSPYSKVEESFNLQAVHDILSYGTPAKDVSISLRSSYDHFEFPGAVPRTFVGAVILAGLSQPILAVVGWQHVQLIVRAVLGLFNAFALLRYKNGIDKAFGNVAGRWYILLQAAQFHVIYYASRTLPNMFAFGICTLALRELLPMPTTGSAAKAVSKRHRLVIYLFVLAGVIFRSEIALLLFTNLTYLLLQQSITLRTIFWTGFLSAAIALLLSVPIDSYFWQKPVWPELAGFIYNAIKGKSSEWGTSPFHAYFTSFLPKLLLNPAIPLVLTPLACNLPATRGAVANLLIPTVSFIAIYSIQPHKEARFIIYAVPPLTACAASAAAYVTNHRNRSLLYRALHLGLILSVIGSLLASFAMLAISSFNYPGGEALWRLHRVVEKDYNRAGRVRVYMDVLTCMTGATRFQQEYPDPPFPALISSLLEFTSIAAIPTRHDLSLPSTTAQPPHPPVLFYFDKTENETTLLDPVFWTQFDYILTSQPERAIGSWYVAATISAFSGFELLRPGQVSSRSSNDNESESYAFASAAAAPTAQQYQQQQEPILAGTDQYASEVPTSRILLDVLAGTPGTRWYAAVRDVLRERLTRGWWLGPRLEPRIRILRKRAK